MIPELVLPAEATGSVAGLVNYNPLAAQPLTKTWIYEPLMIDHPKDEYTRRLLDAIPQPAHRAGLR
jgi:hypothetical protein